MLKRLLSWVAFGALLYYAASAVQSPAPSSPEASPAPAATATPSPAEKYPALYKATNVERWKRAINPAYAKEKDAEAARAAKQKKP